MRRNTLILIALLSCACEKQPQNTADAAAAPEAPQPAPDVAAATPAPPTTADAAQAATHADAESAEATAEAPALVLEPGRAYFAVLDPGTPRRFTPDEKAEPFVLGDGVPEVHRVLAFEDGWLKLQTFGEANDDAHCAATQGGALHDLAITVWVPLDAALEVSQEPITATWQGERVTLLPGVPRDGLTDAELELAEPVAASKLDWSAVAWGRVYTPQNAPSPMEPKRQVCGTSLHNADACLDGWLPVELVASADGAYRATMRADGAWSGCFLREAEVREAPELTPNPHAKDKARGRALAAKLLGVDAEPSLEAEPSYTLLPGGAVYAQSGEAVGTVVGRRGFGEDERVGTPPDDTRLCFAFPGGFALCFDPTSIEQPETASPGPDMGSPSAIEPMGKMGRNAGGTGGGGRGNIGAPTAPLSVPQGPERTLAESKLHAPGLTDVERVATEKALSIERKALEACFTASSERGRMTAKITFNASSVLSVSYPSSDFGESTQACVTSVVKTTRFPKVSKTATVARQWIVK